MVPFERFIQLKIKTFCVKFTFTYNIQYLGLSFDLFISKNFLIINIINDFEPSHCTSSNPSGWDCGRPHRTLANLCVASFSLAILYRTIFCSLDSVRAIPRPLYPSSSKPNRVLVHSQRSQRENLSRSRYTAQPGPVRGFAVVDVGGWICGEHSLFSRIDFLDRVSSGRADADKSNIILGHLFTSQTSVFECGGVFFLLVVKSLLPTICDRSSAFFNCFNEITQ